MDWQPIETAPKDRSSFLAANMRSGKLYIVRWDDAYNELTTDIFREADEIAVRTGEVWVRNLTHWMTLPSPPQKARDQ